MEGRRACKWSAQTNKIPYYFGSYTQFQKEDMSSGVEYMKGQNKAFISGEKVINYNYKVWELCTMAIKVINFEENYLVVKKIKISTDATVTDHFIKKPSDENE